MKLEVLCVLFMLAYNIYGKRRDSTVRDLLQLYSHNLNSSLNLSKSDRELLNSWTEEFQVKQVNISTKYRLQMVRHKEHSFRKINDKKWVSCIDIHSIDIQRSQQTYIQDETECIKGVMLETKHKRQAVDQVEREIKKWRKSYKYLSHLCGINYPHDPKGAGACLVDFIERDDYNSTLQRLIMMKLGLMSELYLQLSTAMINLEQCLRKDFSSFLNTVRTIVEALHTCYYGIKV